MRGAEPERVMAPLDFLYDGVDVWKPCFVFHSRESIAAHYSIKLFLSLPLDLGVSWDQGREPLHNGSRLCFHSVSGFVHSGGFKCS